VQLPLRCKKKKLSARKTFCHTMQHPRYVTLYNEISYLFYQELPRKLRWQCNS